MGEKLVKKTQDRGTSNLIKVREGVMKGVFILSSAFAVVALLAIFVFLLIRGVPAITEIGFFNFIFGRLWHPVAGSTNESYGILPMLLTSIYVMLLSTSLGVILGLSASIFIFKFCPQKIVGVVRQLINLLAGVPSVIFGLFGLMTVVPFLREISPDFVGHGILAASIILAVMVLPTIVAISLNAFYAVPKYIYEGALALGATKEQAVFRTVLPAAKSGVMAGVVLAMARAIGETMAVIMVIGGSPNMPTGVFQSLETMTAVIARNAGYADGLAMEALIGIGVVLFVFTLSINFVFMILKNRGEKKLSASSSDAKKGKGIPVLREVAFGLSWLFGKIKWGVIWFFEQIKRGVVWILQITRITFVWEKLRDFVDSKWLPSKQKRAKFFGLRIAVYIFTALALSALVGIVAFILVQGLPHLNWNFVFGSYSLDAPTLRPAITGTLMIIGIAISIGAPVGIGTAIFLAEYASKSRFVKYIRVAVETLAGIPSIVYGLFGFIVFVALFGWGFSILGGGITLSIMILPVIIRTTEESLLAVPKTHREGSFALGASKVRTTFCVVLPSAAGGIVSSLILAIGRIVGESAALLLTIGLLSSVVPGSVMSGGTTLALAVYYYGGFVPGGAPLAAATGVVLLGLIMILNLTATLLGRLLTRGKR